MIKRGINMGFFIGGDGTHRGIKALTKVFKQKKAKVILVGIPKTIIMIFLSLINHLVLILQLLSLFM